MMLLLYVHTDPSEKLAKIAEENVTLEHVEEGANAPLESFAMSTQGFVNDDVAVDQMKTVNNENLNDIVLPNMHPETNEQTHSLPMLSKKTIHLSLNLNLRKMKRLKSMLRSMLMLILRHPKNASE